MTINKIHQNTTVAFGLGGRLDTTTAPQLQEVLIPAFDEAGVKEIKLDFTNLAYISSAGLRVLLMGEKTAKTKGLVMVLTGVCEEIMEIFEMTGFADMLSIEQSV